MNTPAEVYSIRTVTENNGACKHYFKQVPKCNLAKCDCGKVIYRQNYDKR